MQRFHIFFLLILLLVSKLVIAQSFYEGIYLSASDFKSGKISYSKIQNKTYRLKLNELFNTSTIKVISDDSSYTFKKDSIFGFCDKSNNKYRFYENTKYRILNPNEKLLLYSANSLGGPKNNQTVTNYFFSANAFSSIYKLTKSNLKKVFLNDKFFCELLDIYFSSDKSLIEYDNYLKIYKLSKIEKISDTLKINTNKK